MAFFKIAIFVAISAPFATALPTCVCTRELMPVCGSDGKTYANFCQLDCAKSQDADLSVAYIGRCTSPNMNCMCTMDYTPVCGTNGLTYPNMCALRCAQRSTMVDLESDGECTDRSVLPISHLQDCVCTREKNPQCGSDGITYANTCLLRCVAEKTGITLAHSGTCAQGITTQETCACPKMLQPVCGANGVTYNNYCMLRCANQDLVKYEAC